MCYDVKISVVVPIYKSEKYISACIESVLAQSYTNFELLLVDDGSPDNCGQICDSYAKKDARIRVIHQKNQGVSATRNNGIHAARGKYIVFVDSDDTIDSEYLNVLFDEISSDEFDCVVCGYRVCYPKRSSDVCFEKDVAIYDVRKNERLITKIYDQKLLNSPWNKIYKKEYITEYFDSSIAMGEDLVFNLHYFSKISNVKVISKALYNYMIHSGSAVTTYKPNRMNDVIKMNNYLLDFYSNTFVEATCRADVVNRCLREIDGLYRHLFRGQNTKQERKDIIKCWCEGDAYRSFCEKYAPKDSVLLADYEKLYRHYNKRTWLERKIVKILH